MSKVEVEVEIVKATKVKEDKFKARQDYLAALVRSIDKLDQDKWDNLSDEAILWHTAAVAQMDKKRQIEDFNNEDMKRATKALAEEFEDAEPASSSANTEEDLPPEEDAHSTESNGDGNEPLPEDEAPEQEVKEKKKPVKKPKAKKVKEPSPDVMPGDVERYAKITGEKDRFGITIGTKTHDAVKMYATPDGATLKQTGDAFGGRHYNILAKLAKDGHKVEKLPGGVWRVSHKDD